MKPSPQTFSAPARQREKRRLKRPFPVISLESALKKALGAPALRRRMDALPVIQIWDELVGETIAQHVQPVALDKGVLTLEADSAVWRQQISFTKKELQEKILARLGRQLFKDIRIK